MPTPPHGPTPSRELLVGDEHRDHTTVLGPLGGGRRALFTISTAMLVLLPDGDPGAALQMLWLVLVVLTAWGYRDGSPPWDSRSRSGGAFRFGGLPGPDGP